MAWESVENVPAREDERRADSALEAEEEGIERAIGKGEVGFRLKLLVQLAASAGRLIAQHLQVLPDRRRMASQVSRLQPLLELREGDRMHPLQLGRRLAAGAQSLADGGLQVEGS